MKALSRRTARGRRAPTIYEVARRAGVSIATVSRVQRGADVVAGGGQGEGGKPAIADLAYRPSRLGRSLAAGTHDAIGIVFPDLSGPYYSAVILGVEEATASIGRSVLILGTHRRPDAPEQVVELADRVDGLVLTGQTVDDATVAELGRRRVPMVLLARPAAGSADRVTAENVAAAEALVGHLIEHGHRRIAFLGDPERSADVAERHAGFLAAHRAAGIEPAFDPVRCEFREPDGRAAAHPLLERADRPTAVVAANDEIALGTLDAARDLGIRLPDELAVTGWDDIPLTRHVTPALTTVRQPMLELGRRAAALLHDRITSGREEPRHEVLPTELVVRSSCGCNAPNHRKEESHGDITETRSGAPVHRSRGGARRLRTR